MARVTWRSRNTTTSDTPVLPRPSALVPIPSHTTACETVLCARNTQRLTYQLRLALEPECLESPTATAREMPRDGSDSITDTQAICGFRCWASKELYRASSLAGCGKTRKYLI